MRSPHSHHIELQETADSDFFTLILRISKNTPSLSERPHKLKSLIEELRLTLPILIDEEADRGSTKVKALKKILENLTIVAPDILTMKDAYVQILKTTGLTGSERET